jgi:hypothetical protein
VISQDELAARLARKEQRRRELHEEEFKRLKAQAKAA